MSKTITIKKSSDLCFLPLMFYHKNGNKQHWLYANSKSTVFYNYNYDKKSGADIHITTF